jgi:hypothetical protein
METGTVVVSFFGMFVSPDSPEWNLQGDGGQDDLKIHPDNPEWNLRDDGERAGLKIDVTFPDMSTSCSWAAVAIWFASWASGEALNILVRMIVARARESEVGFEIGKKFRELRTSNKTNEELTQDVLEILREAQGSTSSSPPQSITVPGRPELADE